MQITNLQELAKTIDHALLSTDLSYNNFDKGCILAAKYNVATVCVKSCDVERANQVLNDCEVNDVKVCSVVGFPYANVKEKIIFYETQDALNCGAREIDFVIPMRYIVSEDWKSIGRLLYNMCELVSNERGMLTKAIFETGALTYAQMKILCDICMEYKISYVKTSTGFHTTYKIESNGLATTGANPASIRFLVQNAPTCKVKASGGVKTLEDVLWYVNEIGASRIGTSSTEKIMHEAIQKGWK
jgi:deoxyribose-phosphate aldolase